MQYSLLTKNTTDIAHIFLGKLSLYLCTTMQYSPRCKEYSYTRYADNYILMHVCDELTF